MIRIFPSQVIEYIDSFFPWADGEVTNIRINVAQRGEVASLIELTDHIPSELISMSSQMATEFVSAVATIRNGLRIWESGDYRLDILSLQSFGKLDAITLIRRALSHCPDEMPEAGTVDLNFIGDEQLRDSIRLDISTANKDLVAGESKAATVMAGSAVEALLLWVLQERTTLAQRKLSAEILVNEGVLDRKPGPNLDRWNLGQFIEVSSHINIIGPDTSTQARLAQNFRNLIHPGRATRLGQTCDRGTALSAVAAVEHVIRDLAQRYA